MSWAEFRIRLFAYKRIKKEQWNMVRHLGWVNTKASAYVMNPKLMPKTINKFWEWDDDLKNNKSAREKRLEKLMEARKKYENRNG